VKTPSELIINQENGVLQMELNLNPIPGKLFPLIQPFLATLSTSLKISHGHVVVNYQDSAFQIHQGRINVPLDLIGNGERDPFE
jgi:hypothetical protein